MYLHLTQQESEKKLEIVDRNLSTDNRQLRGKIHFLETERVLIKDQIFKLNDTIREKDKKIASLSIYRYNAIHRKVDAVCKVCTKREKYEIEQLRQQEILDKLPPVEISAIKVTSANSVELLIGLEYSDKYVFSALSIVYSDDPTMTERLQTRNLEVTNYQDSFKQPVHIDGLTSGITYYFYLVAGHEKILGTPSKPVMALVDALPNAPSLSSTKVISAPECSVEISFKAPSSTGQSTITRYKLYYSELPNFKDPFLGIDEPVENLKSSDGCLIMTLKDAQMTVPYYFKISAMNMMGEGPLSERSDLNYIDVPPPKPLKPVVKKISATSIQLVSSNVPCRGSPPSQFKITMIQGHRDEKDQENMHKEFLAMPTISANHKKELKFTIDSVEPGKTYKFSVVASNSSGNSPPSDWSDSIDTGKL